MNIYESSEDYLETILVLSKKLGQVRSIDIVNESGYSKPSVSIAMKKLRENECITVDSDGFIKLTSKGMEIASNIYDKHTYITKFLVLLGVNEQIAKEDACKIEHDISEESFKCIKNYYNNNK
ncbi:metal-dependent transcriptional regulator [Sedimentibacter sp. zth1]|uniref:metal-dependent transcriptional regulator n=1 Tax=Sedimentibacter sp. zth1 TaxID=2816908 RepID=UPI001A922441|nr:metal-dependent transcriptional regulator [Sedimentibacter sp. zth1]QSX06070.1 metal-dependent transcriptional regulator [Sedimentibacter sp. zth1]